MARTYDASADAEQLWQLKRLFELELGSNTGGADKQSTYQAKLTDEYRDRYLDWVDDCIAQDPRSVHVVDAEGGDELVGYVFVLPEDLAMIWDAAVLNEVYVREESRGTGVADDLMQAAIATANEQSLPIDRIVLDVDTENDRARTFYDRYHFTQWGEMVARPLE